MAKFFRIRFGKNEMKPDFKEAAQDWNNLLKLDLGTKYCLVDTMVVLPMHQASKKKGLVRGT